MLRGKGQHMTRALQPRALQPRALQPRAMQPRALQPVPCNTDT